MNSKLVNKKLLIFDLDGTLIHSALDLAISVNLMLEKLGKNPFKEEIIHGWVGNGAHTLVWRALSGKKEVDTTLDKSYLSDALALFLKLYEKNLCVATKPYPHVKETLTSLKSKGYRLSLVSNKPFQFIEPILKKLALDGFFEIILGGDSLEKKKPDSLPLLYVCNTLGIDITQSVMIGDSKNDIQAANACQMDSIAVTYGYNYGEDIALYHPSIIINDFKDLIHQMMQ